MMVILTMWVDAAFAMIPPSPAPGWSQTTSLPNYYYQQSLVYWNGFLYQAGGVSSGNGNGSCGDVLYAQVQTNLNMVVWTTNSTYGGLSYSIVNNLVGTWNATTPLPDAVGYPAGVAANGFLYVLSGAIDSEGPYANNSVYYAKINPDGSVGAWQTTTPLPSPEFGLNAVVWNGRIYTTGGNNGLYMTNAVWSAQIQTNGSLSSWVAQAPLPETVEFHASVVANGYIYVLGGSVNSCWTNSVYYSRINANGTLAGWNQTTPLPVGLSEFGAVVAGGQVIVMAGVSSGGPINELSSAALAGDGSLGTWTNLLTWTGTSFYPPPSDTWAFGMAVADNYVFVAGGTKTGEEGTPNVFTMALPLPPTPPTLSLQRSQTNKSVQLNLTSTTNTGFGLLASTNLTTWTNIGWGFTDTNGSLLLQDTNSAQFPRRFYRAYWPLP